MLPIKEAAAILRRGGLVAFPTETVYGLGADASNPMAVARIYEVKGRPAAHPVIVHIADAEQLHRWAREIPEQAARLAARFWPGPLTLVLRRAPGVRDELTGGQDTIGLRVPGHPVALALLREFGGGIAAPSANRFGRVSPTSAEHVLSDLNGDVDMILDGGPCEIGIESTIVDLSRGRPVVLRPGRISENDIAQALGVASSPPDSAAPRAPGALVSHYAPRRPLRLLGPGDSNVRGQGASARCAVMSFHARPAGDASSLWIEASRNPQRYAHDLYANLRALDSSGCEEILVEDPPATLAWAAVRDRLSRACSA
ncbi:MAG TPA: L-threonylcarbamoyladenylate synthase [Burkholderiales bacterium]|nr:L-threonylcarbamoyladenylate synthase [Burkholderiales bacterium]